MKNLAKTMLAGLIIGLFIGSVILLADLKNGDELRHTLKTEHPEK